ncbi:hypothetical protein ABAC460_20680 [Asticcacaulis sp. AC460]|nr:hypothetical protein ABAC460_20680 [Asticcacaulis sp. AC460]
MSGSVVNILNQSGVVRSDIRTSIGAYSGTATGVKLDLTITVVDKSLGCQPVSGYAVYIWHCTANGNYSLYSSGYTTQNYLRGVQVTDANGKVTFTTIFPGCYNGRMPHIHVEVFAGLSTATTHANAVKTTQFAFDRSVCQTLYTTSSLYGSSSTALAGITFASDNVFNDDTAAELAASTVAISGDASSGYTGTVTLTIA